MKRSKKIISAFLLSATMMSLCVPSFIAGATPVAGEKVEDALTIAETNDMEKFGAIKKDTPTEIPTIKEYDRTHTGGTGGTGGSGTANDRTPNADGYYEPPTSSEGNVFGGWYYQNGQEPSQPVRKNSTDHLAFKKWVDAAVMGVKVQITTGTTANSESTDMRIVSSVDSLMYSDAGFFITIGSKTTRVSCRTVYTKLIGVDGEVVFDYSPDKLFCASSNYFTTFTLKNIPTDYFETEIKITPYWVTIDGTMVKGTGVSKTVAECL